MRERQDVKLKKTKSVEPSDKEIWAENDEGQVGDSENIKETTHSVRREVKDTTVKRGDNCTYLGSEVEEDRLGLNFIKLQKQSYGLDRSTVM